MQLPFDSKKYLKAQKEAIEERLAKFEDRLYLEFGGKFIDDFHAVRTLPGYVANNKLNLLLSLKKEVGVIYCVSAKQLAQGKIRGDFGVGYDVATFKAIEDLRSFGLILEGVVINRFEGEKEAQNLVDQLKRMKIKVAIRKEIKNYPQDLELAVSKKGFGSDEYLPVNKKLIVVWGAGPGSGKLSTCLGQIYNEEKRGENSGYAKFETFPVWDLPLKHPVNLAYEAATADLGDYNLIDPWHLKAYDKKFVNYNRDVDSFPILQKIFVQILTKDNFSKEYKSPTDMGVNRLSAGITNMERITEAAKKEVCFYWFRYKEEFRRALTKKMTLRKMKTIMNELKIDETYLKTVVPARIKNGAAIELADGRLVTGKCSKLLRPEAACILNAVKILAGIDDRHNLISPSVINEILKLNHKLAKKYEGLSVSETMLAWAISARDNPLAKKALKCFFELKNCYMHTVLTPVLGDKELFLRLNLWVSTDGK